MNYAMKRVAVSAAVVLLGSGIGPWSSMTGIAAASAAVPTPEVRQVAAQSTVGKALQALQAQLKEGSIFAYYVRDKTLNPQDSIDFTGKGFIFKDYKSFAAKLKLLKGPAVAQPGNLPKGYKLSAANIYPSFPEKDSAMYMGLEQELKEASAAGDENKQVCSKSVSWKRTELTLLQYTKGKAVFSIVTGPVTKLPEEAVPIVRETEKKQEMTINGRKVQYTTDSAKGVGYNHKLVWLDNSGSLQYTLTDNRAGKLTLNELLAVVKTIIK